MSILWEITENPIKLTMNRKLHSHLFSHFDQYSVSTRKRFPIMWIPGKNTSVSSILNIPGSYNAVLLWIRPF